MGSDRARSALFVEPALRHGHLPVLQRRIGGFPRDSSRPIERCASQIEYFSASRVAGE